MKAKPVDHDRMLSNPVQRFHQTLIDVVPPDQLVNAASWKEEFLKHKSLTGDDRRTFAETLFTQLDDMGQQKNKRVYIGPGRDGSSDDKLSIDMKFAPISTKVTFNKTWKEQGYRKTSFGQLPSTRS